MAPPASNAEPAIELAQRATKKTRRSAAMNESACLFAGQAAKVKLWPIEEGAGTG
jgi:hypothetical protein